MSTMIKIAVADDHPAVLAGIQRELSRIPMFSLIGSGRNSTEIVDLLSGKGCDVLVTDYAMPGGKYGDGMAFLAFLRRRFPNIRIVVLTAIENGAISSDLARLGVHSVLSKTEDLRRLVAAIHSAFAGVPYFGESPAAHIRSTGAGTGQIDLLSPREREVVRLFLGGSSIGEIAQQLHRAKQTVSNQKVSAMKKLGISWDIDLFRFGHENGLIASASNAGDVDAGSE